MLVTVFATIWEVGRTQKSYPDREIKPTQKENKGGREGTRGGGRERREREKERGRESEKRRKRRRRKKKGEEIPDIILGLQIQLYLTLIT